MYSLKVEVLKRSEVQMQTGSSVAGIISNSTSTIATVVLYIFTEKSFCQGLHVLTMKADTKLHSSFAAGISAPVLSNNCCL